MNTYNEVQRKGIFRSVTKMLGVVGIIFGFIFSPHIAFAIDVVTAWTLPAPDTNYNFSDSIVLTGEWVLPPDWLGNIYIYQDGVQMHDASHPTANCNLRPAPAGCYIPLNNVGNLASTTNSFNFDIGPQPDGVHNIQVKFWGGETCAVKAELNVASPPPSPLYTGTCPPDETNFQGGQYYPIRSYTVNLPVYPRITVTPTGNPALDFANVITGSQLTKSFSVHNSGQQTLTFHVSGVTPPYYCVGGSCDQSVALNQTKIVSIQFVPDVISTYPKTLTFSCIGAPLPCDIPSLTRNITGNSIGVARPPQVTIVSGTPLDFGSFYLGNPSSRDRNIVVKNTGGGLLNGFFTPPSGEYVCIGGCSYSLFAGDTITKTIRFTPDHADLSRDDIASLSDSGAGATTHLLSSVSDTPVLRACVYGCPGASMTSDTWNAGDNVNIGAHKEIAVYVQNLGGGSLTGAISGLPSRGFSFTPDPSYPYTGITPGMGWVKIGKFNFDPSDALPADASVLFTNDNPIGGNTSTIFLHGQGNDQAIYGGSLTLPFGSVVVGQTKSATLAVVNSGVGVLNINIPFGSLGNPAFACVSNCVLSLGLGATSTITFTFSPTAVATYNFDVDVGGESVALSGTGIQPIIKAYVFEASGAWHLLPYAGMVDYGLTSFGSPVQDKSLNVQIQSTGGIGTRVNYTVDTSSSPHFQCVLCSGTVSADPSFSWTKNVSVVFQPGNAPGGPGIYDETITIHYDFNDAIPRTYVYQVHGESVAAPYMTVTPVSHSYTWPPTVVGNSPTTIFKVKNEGIGLLSGYASVTPSGELVGLWTFDTADMDWLGMNAYDSSGKGNTGSIIGASETTGRFDKALHFSSGQYLNLGANSSAFDFSGDVSGSAWIKTTANGKMITDYQKGNPLIYMSVGPTTVGGNSNKFVVYLRTNSGSVAVFSSNKTVNDGIWHHVAFVRSAQSSVVRLYVDGLLDSSFPYADNGAIGTSGGTHTVSISGAYSFIGDIDDVRFYSRPLSAPEVEKLYNGQVVVYDPVFKCISPIPCEFNNMAPGDTVEVTFSFSPADAYLYSSTPLFTSNGGNIFVGLSGLGVYQPVIKITPISIMDPVTYPGVLNFIDIGTSNLGAYIEKKVRVWNVGRGPLSGNITFTSGVHFSCQPPSTGCVLSVPENSYQDITLRFAPLAVDNLDDFAKFNSNAFNGPQTLQVHGFGIFASIINILGSGQNFPAVVVGKSKVQNITIKNTGTVDFGTGVFSLTGDFTCVSSSAGALVGGLCPYQLDAGGATTIAVRFAPTAVGPANGLVSLSTLSLANFFVSGTGISPSTKFIEN